MKIIKMTGRKKVGARARREVGVRAVQLEWEMDVLMNVKITEAVGLGNVLGELSPVNGSSGWSELAAKSL